MQWIFNKRMLWLGWTLVALFAIQLVIIVLHEERPTSRTVFISPLATTDNAVQR